MNDIAGNYVKWLSHFTEAQFKKVVFQYLKTLLGNSNLVDIDGTGDGGNDVKLLDAVGQRAKVQFQVTIQEKGIEKKNK